MSASATVSICIPAFGQPEMLARCLDSIKRQNFQDFEVIISDDTASDVIQRVVEQFHSIIPVQYSRNSPAMGSPGNWNAAMARARGKYLMVLHHDDWLFRENSLEELVSTLEKSAAALVFAMSFNIDRHGQLVSLNNPDAKQLDLLNADIRNAFYHNWIGAPSAVLIRRRGIRFDDSLKWLVDVDFYIRQVGKGAVAYNPKAAVGIGIGPLQATNSCFGNLEVELRENLLVYAKLRRSWGTFSSDLRHFMRLFTRLRPSRSQLRKFGAPTIVHIAFTAALARSQFSELSSAFRGKMQRSPPRR